MDNCVLRQETYYITYENKYGILNVYKVININDHFININNNHHHWFNSLPGNKSHYLFRGATMHTIFLINYNKFIDLIIL